MKKLRYRYLVMMGEIMKNYQRYETPHRGRCIQATTKSTTIAINRACIMYVSKCCRSPSYHRWHTQQKKAHWQHLTTKLLPSMKNLFKDNECLIFFTSRIPFLATMHEYVNSDSRRMAYSCWNGQKTAQT